MNGMLLENPQQIIARLECENKDLNLQAQSAMLVLWKILMKQGGKFTIQKAEMSDNPESVGIDVQVAEDGSMTYVARNLSEEAKNAEAVPTPA